MMKGKFITFEGIEGCGKSTQAKLLHQALIGLNIPVLATREPGGPVISEDIRRILLNPEYDMMKPETEMLLYMASRCQHTGEWIIPALEEGKMVICDRYNDSTIAYQGAARDLDYQAIAQVAKLATFGIKPDITFLIDLPVALGMCRIQSRDLDRMELEAISFHEKVREEYLSIAKKEPQRIIVINGKKEPFIIHRIILDYTLKLIGDDNEVG